VPKGIRDIRRRVRSIRATQQITRAMQMVSAVKMRRAQDAALRTRAYVAQAVRLLGEIAERHEEFRHPLLDASDGGKTLLIVVSSNRGLAGGLTSNLVRVVQDLLQGRLAGEEVEIATIGRKAFDALSRARLPVVADFSPIPDTALFRDVSPLSSFAMKAFLGGGYARVLVAYTHFVSTLMQRPVVKQAMPLGKELVAFFSEHHAETAAGHGGGYEHLFEPSPAEVLAELLPQLAEMQIFQAVLEAQASEHSARMIAMKNATDAAGDIIDDLSFTANQLRQSSITQEIAEITSGVNALASD